MQSNNHTNLSSSISGHDGQLDQKATQVNRKGKATLASHDKKSPYVKGKKSLKHSTPDSPSSQISALPEGSSNLANVSLRTLLSLFAFNGVGNMSQKQGHYYPRRGASPDQSCSDEHVGVVRRGLNCSMEAHFSNNSNKCKNRELAVGPSGIGSNIKPLVEVSHGCATNLDGGSTRVERAQEAIGNASLGRIRVVDIGEKSDQLQGFGCNPFGELSHIEAVPNSQPSQEMRSALVLQRGHSGNPDLYDGVEAGMGGIQGFVKEVRMKHNCHSQDGN